MKNEHLPLVAVRSLGGTVAMRNDGDGARPVLDAADLLASIPTLGTVARIDSASFSTTPGASLTIPALLSHVHEMEAACEAGAAGIVVTTGTDTAEEVAYLYDLVWRRPEPVVVTGAMRTADAPGSDGPGNLLAAIIVAKSDAARDHGGLLVINDEVHSARTVRKAHTTGMAAFQSPGFGPLGIIHELAYHPIHKPRREEPFSVPAQVGAAPAVAIVRIGLGQGTELLEAAARSHEGVVIETLGGGHVPHWWVEPIRAVAAATPTVITSRAGAGVLLENSYGFQGSERDLRGTAKLFFAEDLDGVKARILLTIALLAEEVHVKLGAHLNRANRAQPSVAWSS